MNWNYLLTIVTNLGFLFTSITALTIYNKSKRDASLGRKKETRARLSEFYFSYHAELLRNSQNTNMAKELFFHEYSVEQTEKILFIYMFLNAAHFEWHLSLTDGHPNEAFLATLDGLFGRFARSINARDQFLILDFDRLYSDFPASFRRVVKDCIARNTAPIRSAVALPQESAGASKSMRNSN